MKFAILFVFLACPLFGQGTGSTRIFFDSGLTNFVYASADDLFSTVISVVTYQVEITRNDDMTKNFKFRSEQCDFPVLTSDDKGFTQLDPTTRGCKPLSESAAKRLAPVQADLAKYYKIAPNVYHHLPAYTTLAIAARPSAILIPMVAPSPQLLFFDGFTYDFIKFDLGTNQVNTAVTLAPQAQLFAIRPTATSDDEVWVSHGGTVSQISIVDMALGKVLATIPITSVDPNNTEPTGLVFTNDGGTALATASFFQADAAGNRGALLVLNAATRKITSTQLLNFAPVGLVMAPDGLTAYLFDSQKIVYYDVLSGTSDLTAPFPYVSGPVLIHPDGTLLYISQGAQMSFFDLTTRKVIAQPKFNFPGNAPALSARMSQDGATIYATDGKGNVVVLGTRYGELVTSYKTAITTTNPADSNTQVLPMPR